ncbi:MAG: hypothetical protein GY936_10325, partial [Ignavibacteriae bacterium]|nr:hypothetical protein [Ignavibacteriota bacterium]
MAARYETGTKNQVMLNAVYGALLSETEFLRGYDWVHEPSKDDIASIEKSKATIKDFERLK